MPEVGDEPQAVVAAVGRPLRFDRLSLRGRVVFPHVSEKRLLRIGRRRSTDDVELAVHDGRGVAQSFEGHVVQRCPGVCRRVVLVYRGKTAPPSTHVVS